MSGLGRGKRAKAGLGARSNSVKETLAATILACFHCHCSARTHCLRHWAVNTLDAKIQPYYVDALEAYGKEAQLNQQYRWQ